MLYSLFIAVKVKRDFRNIYLEMNIFSSTKKIFEKEKGDEKRMILIYLIFLRYIYIIESFNYYYNEVRLYTYL